MLTAKTTTQAERLATLVRGYGLPVPTPEPATLELVDQVRQGETRVLIGPLEDGFTLVSEALTVITEREIFGERSTRKGKTKKRRDKARAFVEDLRELRAGDYVAHEQARPPRLGQRSRSHVRAAAGAGAKRVEC